MTLAERPSAQSNGRGPDRARAIETHVDDPGYNLAERIVEGPPAEAAYENPPANETYNLASSIYNGGRGNGARTATVEVPSAPAESGNGDASYNLAERVYADLEVVAAESSAKPAPALDGLDGGVPPTAPTVVAVPQRRRRWRLPRTFEALEFGPFRWYIGATILWNAAMSMQMLARGYLAFNLTGDFRALGLVSVGSALPMLLLSPLGGVIADRTSRRAVLQLGQGFSVLLAVVVAALLLSGNLVFWHLVGASIAQGVMMALVMPSRQAFLPEVVGMGRLMNAIPLQSAGMNLMQLIAPAIGGFMIDWIGAGSVYSVMAVMYAFSVIALFGVRSMSAEDLAASRSQLGAEAQGAMRRGGSPRASRSSSGGAMAELRDGLAYTFRDRTILAIVSLSFLTSVLAMPIRMLLPGYVAAVFGDSGATLGLLQSAMAIGALVGALGLATMRMRRHRGLLFAGSAVLMGIAMLAFSTTAVFLGGALGLFVIGIGSAGRQSMSQLLVQEYVQDEYRGRVMAVFMMQFSVMSVGVLAVAILMEALGAQLAIASVGVLLVAATLAFVVLVPRLRKLA